MPPVPKSKSNPAKIISVGKGILDEPLSDDLPASHSEAPSHTDSTDTSSSDVSQNNFTELVVPGPVHSPDVGQSNSTPQHPARLVVPGPVHSPGVGQSNSTPQHPARLVVPGQSINLHRTNKRSNKPNHLLQSQSPGLRTRVNRCSVPCLTPARLRGPRSVEA